MDGAIDLTRREAVAAAAARLGAAGVESARANAEWLLAGLLGIGRAALGAALDAALSPALAERYDAAVRRRARCEPLQRILGWEDFRGLRLEVTSDVLIPRPETELLVECALERLPTRGAGRRPVVVDIGTGSGCIACALATERPDAAVIASDVSAAALAVAGMNVRRLGLTDRVRLVRMDLVQALRPGVADLIIANLPYLPTGSVPALAPEVKDHEPRRSLDGGADGLGCLRRLITMASAALMERGALVLETAGAAQAMEVAALVRGADFADVEVRRDLAGVDRFVIGMLE